MGGRETDTQRHSRIKDSPMQGKIILFLTMSKNVPSIYASMKIFKKESFLFDGANHVV